MILTDPTYDFHVDPVIQVVDELEDTPRPMGLTRVRVTDIDGTWNINLTGHKLDRQGRRKTQDGWPIYNPDVEAQALEAFLVWRAAQ